MRHETYIAGVIHHLDAGAILREMPQDHLLVMHREPLNPYDPNAIRLSDNGLTLGFVPRDIAAIVAPVVDAGGVVIQCVRTTGKKIEITYQEEKTSGS